MPRRKVTFEYDPAKAPKWLLDIPRAVDEWPEAWTGVDALSVTIEELPDPPICQKFIVERVATPEQGRKTASHVYARLSSYPDDGQITVTEVTDA